MLIDPHRGYQAPRVTPDGRTAYYSRFHARYDPEEVRELTGIDAAVALDVEIDRELVAYCRGVEITAADGGEVTWRELRSLRLDRLLREAKTSAASFWAPGKPGRYDALVAEQRAATIENVRHAPQRGRPLDDEHLRQVAACYRDAAASRRRPTKAVMLRWYVSRATASRWVRAARDRRLLDPA